MKPLRKRAKFLRFLVSRNIIGFSVPSEPKFESPEVAAWFAKQLEGARYYVEFGSGGSTFLAAQLGVKFTTVESDEAFLKAVKDKISAAGYLNPERQVYHWADVGFTGPLGKPVSFGSPAKSRIASYRKYSDLPPVPGGTSELPDLVLVDGRFRVACALKTIRTLAGSDGWTLVVDDYGKRAEYGIIDAFAEKVEMRGRMAVFRRKEQISCEALSAAISHYEAWSP